MNTGKIGSTIKTYLTIILSITVAVLLLTRNGCGKDDVKITSYYHPDSTYNSVSWDTIKIHDTTLVPHYINNPKSKEISKTLTKDSIISKETNIYNDSLKDNFVISYYKIKTIGILSSFTLENKLINRKEIKRIDTIKTFHTNEIIINNPPKWSLYSGINLYGSKTSFDVSPEIGLRYKNKMVDVGYNIVSQQYKFGVKIVLFNSKK